mgnify:FL=1
MSANMHPLPDVIEPRWWTGDAPVASQAFTIDCADLTLDDDALTPGSELGERMNAMFDDIGLVYLTNSGLTNLADMRRAAKLVIENEMRYEAGANPRDSLEANVYEVGAPLQAWLHYHHEMAYVGTSTTMLGFLAKHSIGKKGATFVSDNIRATDAILETDFGQKLKELGLCYHRDLTDRNAFDGTEEIGVYNHWQKSMMTEDPDEAEAFAQARGLETEWGPNRLLKTRYYISAYEYFPPLDRNVLFSSVADDGMWFDTWPKVKHLPYDQRPLKLTFGDLSEMTRAEKALFVDVYDRFGIPINWNVGDVAVVCNWRWAHGRPGIQLEPGQRRDLGVLIGESFDRVGDLDGKW